MGPTGHLSTEADQKMERSSMISLRWLYLALKGFKFPMRLLGQLDNTRVQWQKASGSRSHWEMQLFRCHHLPFACAWTVHMVHPRSWYGNIVLQCLLEQA